MTKPSLDRLYGELHKQYFSDEMQEQEEIELLPQLLDGASLFVDVGASIGQYSYFAGKTLKKSRIVAIEADPLRYQRLKELTEKWSEGTDNSYEVIHAAASDKDEKIKFFITNESLCGGIFKYWVPKDPALIGTVNWTEVEIQAVTLDSLFPESDPDLVKIDVEGAEYRVICGAINLITRGHTKFLVEIHPWGDTTISKRPSDVFDLFWKHGYDFKRTHRHWLFYKNKIQRPSLLKSKIVGWVLNHEQIKRTLKGIAHKLGVFKSR